MPTGLAEIVCKRFDKAVKRKTNWETLYQEALCYVAPHRETFYDAEVSVPGQDKSGKGEVFDSTAIDGVQKFVSNLQSSLVPPMKEWIGLKPGALIKKDQKMAEGLADVSSILFSNLQNSNFDTQMSESFYDLAIGTGALLAFKGDVNKPFRFVNVPLSQLYLEEGPNGIVETSFRKFKVAGRNIEPTWDDAKISKEMKEKMSEDEGHEFSLIEATYPDDVEIFNIELNKKEKVKGFRYVVVEKQSKHVLVEREMRSSPWIVFRWSTLPGEIYGRGPALIALPDIKTLNKTKELLLKSASMAILGMYTAVDDGTLNVENIKLAPGAIIPVAANEGSMQGATLRRLDAAARPDLAQIIINDLRASINSQLFADPLGPVDLPVKTATEMQLRQAELAKRIGASFGRLQFELIQPLVNRLLDILDELGLIDLGEYRVDGNIIAIEHVSPLSRAQDEEEVMSIFRYMEAIVGMYGPEALHIAAPIEKILKEIGPRLNVPPSIVPTEEELDERTAEAAQAMGAVQQQQV